MNCFMISRRGQGGNALSDHTAIIRRNAALGDVLCGTVVADKLAALGFEVQYQAHDSTHCLLRRVASVHSIAAPNGFCHVNLDGTYENDPRRRQKHFHQMFMDAANIQLRARGIDLGPTLNCKPKMRVSEAERDLGRMKLEPKPRPWIFICPRSNSYANRQIPDGIWDAACREMPGTKFWLGTHPAPPSTVDLQCRHIDNLIVWLSAADLLVTVDTGPLHMAAALGIPIIALEQASSPEKHLSDQVDFITLRTHLDCLDCQQNICPINHLTPPCQNYDPTLISGEVNRRIKGGVSAAISIYRPEAATVNRCLECVLPQVDEVVITYDNAGKVPDGLIQNPKIRIVHKQLKDIGYGRKQNFGVRHTHGQFIVLLNDDVFLDPGAVDRMLDVMKDPKVGMVSNHLRYADGTIYHAGKIRGRGQMGWHHLDHRKFIPTIKEPTELENCCGACVLVRRQAYYAADGFDEEFYLMAEDDAMCLAFRREGWKIMFTPHSTAVHLEHQSVKKTGDITGLLQRSNATFHRKWHKYLEWNADRIPGDYGYLKA